MPWARSVWGSRGSHIVQQLAHIGFQRYVIYDTGVVEESNLNRLVRAKSRDVSVETPKLRSYSSGQLLNHFRASSENHELNALNGYGHDTHF
jgi:hypothetical protein